MSDGGTAADGPIDVDVDIEADRTVVTVSGERDAAVVVYSESGERIYLPPDDEDGSEAGGDPYRSAGGESPYQGDRGEQTPYGSSRRTDPSVGMNPTADGFRILHPEPVHDIRLLR